MVPFACAPATYFGTPLTLFVVPSECTPEARMAQIVCAPDHRRYGISSHASQKKLHRSDNHNAVFTAACDGFFARIL
eukprot:7634932-Pyramimonas_sp.AAC.1